MTAALLTAALGLVPADAHGFVVVPAAALYGHPLMKGVRDAVAAAGPQARAAFDKQTYPPADTLVGLTVFFPKVVGREPVPVGLFSFTAPVDGTKLRLLYLPQAKPETIAGKTVFWEPGQDIGLHFPDAQHVAVSSRFGFERWFAAPGGGGGPLAAAAKVAAAGDKIVAALDFRSLPLPPQFAGVPEPYTALAAAKTVVVTVDLVGPEMAVAVRAGYEDAAAAADAEKAAKAAAGLAKSQLASFRREMEANLFAKADAGPQNVEQMAKAAGALIGLGGMNQADALLDNLPLKVVGSDLTASVTVPKEVTGLSGMYTGAIGVGFLLPAVQKAREAAARTAGANNLKQIALAMHNYHDTHAKLPPAAICDKNGKKLLSWRVAVLPYTEQNALYRQFKLDEPWDSEHNKKLIPTVPKLYVSPRYDHGAQEGKTVYKAFVGGGAMFDWKEGVRFAQVTDGLSNTFMVAEGGDPVIWTKPDDFDFDPARPLPKLGPPGNYPGINVAMGDGSVRFVQFATMKEATLKAYISRAGGEIIGDR